MCVSTPGTDIGGLQVVLRTGSRDTPLWWLSGDQGDHWRHGEVRVARVPHLFSILFEAARSFSHLGDVAIDDISFSNCTLPGRLTGLTATSCAPITTLLFLLTSLQYSSRNTDVFCLFFPPHTQ